MDFFIFLKSDLIFLIVEMGSDRFSRPFLNFGAGRVNPPRLTANLFPYGVNRLVALPEQENGRNRKPKTKQELEQEQ